MANRQRSPDVHGKCRKRPVKDIGNTCHVISCHTLLRRKLALLIEKLKERMTA